MSAFASKAIFPDNPMYAQATSRLRKLYHRDEELRSPFYRDYTRILHCNAYRRLKHKTQVFFATGNDHICTRMEHVQHVAAVSYTLAKALGLNTELAQAIALGHDLGHAPFGHHGEAVLAKLVRRELGVDQDYWHERNSLRFADSIETLPDALGHEQNLNLTYAVRDGIICHCGEVSEEALAPRQEAIDLAIMRHANQYAPWTWEGCVMKIADKIAFLGRDLEDAVSLGILSEEERRTLARLLSRDLDNPNLSSLSNTLLINTFVEDLLLNSSLEKGIRFSRDTLKLIRELATFSYRHIYDHPRLKPFAAYATLLLEQLYSHLKSYYAGGETVAALEASAHIYPVINGNFSGFLKKYGSGQQMLLEEPTYGYATLYDLSQERDYRQAVLDFISGMTDHYAIKTFQELLYL